MISVDPLFNCASSPLLVASRYLVLAILLGFFLTRRRGRFDFLVLVLIFCAGFLNVFEYFTTGCVYDPFDFFGLFHFNWRDVVITAGSVALIIKTVYDKQ